MVETTGSHPKKLWPGVKRFFGVTYAENPMVCDTVFPEYSSDKAYEEYVEETAFGLAAIKPEGAGVSYDTSQQGYTSRIRNITYAIGAKVTMEKIQDNQYESEAQKKSRMLARAMRNTKETVFANILNRAFNSSYTGGDGKELLATDHPSLIGNQANELAVGADLSEASLEDLLILIDGFTDSRGNKIDANGQTLVVPRQLRFEAVRLLETTQQPGTANNDINAMRAQSVLPGGMVVWKYLTDASAFFITTDINEGLIRQERMNAQLTQDNDFDTKNACMMSMARYAGGWADWRGIVGTKPA